MIRKQDVVDERMAEMYQWTWGTHSGLVQREQRTKREDQCAHPRLPFIVSLALSPEKIRFDNRWRKFLQLVLNSSNC